MTDGSRAERTARRMVSRTAIGRVTMWVGLAAGVAMFIGYYVTLPLWLLGALLAVIVCCAGVLAVDQIPREPQRRGTSWRRLRRFCGWLVDLLP